LRARAERLSFAVAVAAGLCAAPSSAQGPAPSGDPLRVLVGARETSIPVVRSPAGGRALRADLLAESLGGSLRRLPNGHQLLSLPGVSFDLAPDLPFARTGADSVVPLAAPPFVAGGKLYVPLQLASDALPRLGSGVLFDAARGEIRTFSATASSAGRPAATPGLAVESGARRSGARDADPRQADDAIQRAPVRRAAIAAPTRLARRHTVVVDAGHGGPDNGMTGPIKGSPKIYEKNVTLEVAEELEKALRARGVDVVMTRTTDTLIALGDRGRIANASHADLFLSVHVNAANMKWKNPGGARGFETYFLAEAKTEDARRVERMENEAIRFETNADTRQGDPLSFIINDMAQNEHLRESSELAEIVQRELAEMHPGPDRGVKQAGFRVLVTAFMPAVLIEIGFGTNAAEAKFITGRAGQRRLAAAIADAAVEYLAHYERRVRDDSR